MITAGVRLAIAVLAQVPTPATPTSPTAVPAWLIAAPIPTDTGPARVTRDYLGGEAAAFPDSGQGWRRVEAADNGLVNLNRVFGEGASTAFSAVYAFAYIESPREDTRTLILASDDDVAAWLNGQLIHHHEVARGYQTDRDTLTVRLAAGWNTLLVKIVNQQGGFGFGAWLEGSPWRSVAARPTAARARNLPAPALTIAPLRVLRPGKWIGATITAPTKTSITAWGAVPATRADVRLVTGRDTVGRSGIDTLTPGRARPLDARLDLTTLARAALGDSGLDLIASWAGGPTRRRAPVDPAEVLALAESRLELEWTQTPTTLSATVIVPAALAGLTVDLLGGELRTSRFLINQNEHRWQSSVVMLCGPCRLGDTLRIRVDRDTTRPFWDAPTVRVRETTFTDLARNARLLTALGNDPTVGIALDAVRWLAALLSPEKEQYRTFGAGGVGAFRRYAERARRDTIHLVGNSHIDAAWLWRAEETQGVVENTWRTALKLQEKFPGITFAASAAQYYEWLAVRAPGLRDSIVRAAARGTWHPVGGWWLEADQNVPSGESLVRQGLYGQRYFTALFGRPATIAWTPDSFGYPWTLPQILLKSGFSAFVTQKIRWNDSTEFPHDAFFWVGRDGSRIFSYNPWGYDHDLDGATLARQMQQDNARTDSARHMLVLYGVGDHGGGPTIEMLERREDLQRLPAFPVLRDDTPARALQTIRAARADTAWPSWNDELYLEYHRGTYTSQAEMKRRNRRGEELLGTTEMLAALDTAPYPRAPLLGAWRQLLFNQFHDILPGSSIGPVYADAKLTHDSVVAAATPLRDAALRRLAAGMDTRGSGQAVVVFNSASWVRSSYAAVPLDSALRAIAVRGARAVDAAERAVQAASDGDSLRFFAREVPPLGFKVFWIRPGRARGPTVTATPTSLENDFLRVEVDLRTGQLTRIYDKQAGRDALALGGRGNVLHLYGDRPRNWDAWDIGYTGEDWKLDSVTAVRPGGDSIARWIEFEKPWNASRVVQRIVLRAEERWVTIENRVDWHENRKLLKVAFEWNTRADSAWYEIAYGAIGQPTAPNTQAERAKYEHAGHRWGDVSDSTWGVSLLNDSKYGWDTRGKHMRLSLLRAPKWPDSTADMGRHSFRYAVYPHAGDWRSAGTVRRGIEFNQPLQATRVQPHPGLAGRSWSFATVDADNVYITAVKRAEDTDAKVVRVVEWHGQPARVTITFGSRLARVRMGTLLEEPLGTIVLPADRRSVTLNLRPWEIVTLIVEEAR